MSDDEDFVPSAGICTHCGYAKAYGHVCRAAGKQMRSTFLRKSMSAHKLGKGCYRWHRFAHRHGGLRRGWQRSAKRTAG